MALGHSPSIVRDGLVMYYDMSNTKKSWMGAPAINRIVTVPLSPGVYAYASGPVATTVIDASYQPRTVNRYTVSATINTARAAIYPPGGSLALSTPYAFSCIWKYNGTNTTSPSFVIDPTKGLPEVTGANSFSTYTQTNTSLANGWTYSKAEFTLSASPTLGSILTFGISTGADATYLNNTFDVYNIQFEQNTYATPYVEGTRANTQAILDLTGNNTLTATSLTYAADGTFSFNGSNYIDLPVRQIIGSGAGTVSAIINIPSAQTDYNCIFSCETGADWNNLRVWLSMHGANQIRFTVSSGVASSQDTYATTALSYNVPYFITGTYDGVTIKIYINGALDTSYSSTVIPGTFTPTLVRIGHHYSSRYFNGKIYTLSTYNRALTATEVDQNFQAHRDRYGI